MCHTLKTTRGGQLMKSDCNKTKEQLEQELMALQQESRTQEEALQESCQQLKAAKQKLQATEAQLEASNRLLEANEKRYKQQTLDLKERLKELNCLHRIAELASTLDDIDEILQETTETLALSWLYPDITRVKITYNGKEFFSQAFDESPWKLSATIAMKQETLGLIEVFYIEERPTIDIGPFMKEEQNLVLSVARTINDFLLRKAANQDLVESETKFRNIAEQSIMGVCILQDDVIKYVNEAMCGIYGYTTQEILSWEANEYFKIFSGEHLALIKEQAKLKQEGSPRQRFHYIVKGKKKDGSTIWIDNYSRTMIYNGRTADIITQIDITERINAEEQLKEKTKQLELKNLELQKSQKQLDATSQMAKTGGWQVDLLGNTLRWTSETYRIHEIPEDDPPNVDEIVSNYHPDDQAFVGGNIQKAIETGEDFDFRARLITAKNNLKWIRAFGTVVAKDGRTVGLHGMIQDVTELKNAEDKLKESEEKYRALFENAGLGIGYYNTEGRVISYNQVAAKNMSGTPEDFIDKSVFELFPKKEAKRYLDRIQKATKSSIPEVYEDYVSLPSSKYYFLSTFTRVMNNEGEVLGIQIISQDITEIRNTRNELIKAKKRAEESERLKTAFLANMSHEIRTPMNGILGFTSLLKNRTSSAEQTKKYIDIIEKSGNRMLNTINDIVDISRIEAGQVEVINTEQSINALFDELYAFFNNEVKSNGIKLIKKSELSYDESIIISDHHKIEGILTNLIKNAIKFTEEGYILFGCRLSPSRDRLEFYVEDTGIGIASERIEAIFNRFEQADIEDKRALQGSGLGLAISKSYVEMMGGSISVSSTAGKGSKFVFDLPYQFANESQNKTQEENDFIKP